MKARRQADAAPSGASLMWAQGLACGGILAFMPALGLLLAALFWPVVVALVLDKAPGRPVARGVALCAAAASVGAVRSAWSGGLGLNATLALATDLHVLATAWLAAAGGWALAGLAPLAARAAMDAASAARTARLRAERTRLRARFGWDEAADEGSAGPDL
jgi:hypothetical protein